MARQKPVPQSPASADVYKAAYRYVKTQLENGTFDCFYSFPSFGGMIIANVETAEQLWLEIFGYPLAAGYDWEVQPLANTLVAWASQWSELTGRFPDQAA